MSSAIVPLASLLGISFASGVNLYAAVLVAGLGIRYHWLTGLPPELAPLGHPLVLAVAAVLYCFEFFADKIPVVSAVWDAIHTFVRPVGAAVVALAAGSQLSAVDQTIMGLTGGAVALASHGAKMGVRLLAHGTGEPFTPAAISVGEDVFAVTLVMLVSKHPYIALTIVCLLLALIACLLPLLWKAIRGVVCGIARWWNRWFGPQTAHS